MDFSYFKNKNNIIILTDINNQFSDEYLALRKKENRVLTDNQVKILPQTKKGNPNFNEWHLRQKTANRFLNYLKNKQTLSILDIGCGNGWFSHKMSELDHNIVALDVNLEELEQASRVFKTENLQFVYADIFELNDKFINKFDVITLNASVQYFQDFEWLMSTLKSFLKMNGEIHILDSPFYKASEIKAAKKRTLTYYSEMGFPEMASHYFHHSKNEIKNFDVLYQPKKSIINKIFGKKESPFMWLCLNLSPQSLR
jgi:2-polyprenyl-3-methyl-5-hydroxy-6-metoxy-1,4-benzoquinol methylase